MVFLKLVASKGDVIGPVGWSRFIALPALVQNTSEDEMLLGTVRRFVEKEVLPQGGRIAENQYPRELVRRMGQLGLLGLTFSEPDESCGRMSSRLLVQVVEEIGRKSPSLALLLNVQGGIATKPIALLGTEEQKRRWLYPALRGELIGAFGLTGPEAGSDAVNMTTGLERRDGKLFLNGEKTFITQGAVADTVVVFARSESVLGTGGRKIAAVVVERGAPGFIVLKEDAQKIGMHGTVTSTLKFEDVIVPPENVLGGLADGIEAMKQTLFAGRITISAVGLGIIRAALETSYKYAQERKAGGRPIGDYQLTQLKLVRLLELYQTSRLLIHEAAALKDKGCEFFPTACVAKKYVAKAATEAALLAQEIFGGAGYTLEPNDGVFVGNLIGDSRLIETGEGTGEMQVLELARRLGFQRT